MSGAGLTTPITVTAIIIGDAVNPTIANQPHNDITTNITMLYNYLKNDGTGSGIDADYLNEQHGAYYLALANATGTLLAANFTDTSHGTRSGGTLHANASDTTAGFMSAADKSKLDGIGGGANNYVLPAATTTTLGGVIVGSGLSVAGNGTLSTNIPLATTSAAGLMQVGTYLQVTAGVVSVNTSNIALLSAANTFTATQLAPAWNTPSARELKTNVQELDLSHYNFKQLAVKSWEWTKESGFEGYAVGAIADEVMKIAPEVIGDDGKSIDYSKLAFLMVAKLYAEA